MTKRDLKTKNNIVLVFTGEGKGKTSAALGLMARALGAGWQVAFIQFIKSWDVNEHKFIKDIAPIFKEKLMFYKGGAGFYKASNLSAKNVSEKQHKQFASDSYNKALRAVSSGKYNLVICDEINNAVHDGLLTKKQLVELIKMRSSKTSLCLTGRNFPQDLLKLADIVTDMQKTKHHFDDGFVANFGIDY